VIEIRLSRPDEIPGVLALWAEATDVRPTDTPASLAVLIEHGALLLAIDDGEIIGSIVAGWDGWRGNIYRLAVAPAQRRRGIATALVVHAERRLREAGASRMSMLVASDEPDAIDFWTSIDGISLDARMTRYIKDL
jgi:ribosomal protein S18 acetylase RimI-like enzyme